MARQEYDREDLFAELAAYPRRLEILSAGEPSAITVGFRGGGAASVYFGAEPVYHFNSLRELRRAFWGGRLYKAENRRLAALERRREPAQTVLVRHDLSPAEQAEFLRDTLNRLRCLAALLAGGAYAVGRQTPEGERLVGDLAGWLAELTDPLAVAVSPHVR